MRTIRHAITGTALLGALVGASPALAGTYNAVKQFSTKKNPSGQWSYMWSGNAFSQAVERKKTENECALKKFSGWTNGLGEPNAATLFANRSGKTAVCGTQHILTGYLAMDPQSNANVALRFTAPSTGHATIAGEFRGFDTGEHPHPVAIVQNGESIWTETISSYEQVDAFNLTVAVKAGETIDLETQPGAGGADWTYLGTGLKVTITTGP